MGFGGIQQTLGNTLATAAPAQQKSPDVLECIPPRYDSGKILTPDQYKEYLLKLTQFIDGTAVNFKRGDTDIVLNCKKMRDDTINLEKKNIELIKKIQDKLKSCVSQLDTTKNTQ